MVIKRYAERDVMGLDKAGNYYCANVEAMTAEGLHDKSDIAAELAYRDHRCAKLEAENKRLKQELSRMSKPISVEIPPVVWDHDDLEGIIKESMEDGFGISDKYAKLESLCDRLADGLDDVYDEEESRYNVYASNALAAYNEFKEEDSE